MLSTRYEDYTSLTVKEPCIFIADIYRSPAVRSEQSNWHENPEIQLCVAGEGYVLLDGQRVPFAAGDIVVANSEVIHYTATDTALTYACLIIDAAFCKRAGIDHTVLQFLSRFRNDAVKRSFQELNTLFSLPADPCRTAKIQRVLLDILITLREQYTVAVMPQKNGGETVKNAIFHIRTRYEQPLSLDSLARLTLTDKYSLSRQFKALTGQTVVQYIHRYRCERAAALIGEGIPVGEAARQCGFQNLSFFTKIFSRYMGVLPSAYKKNHNHR